MKQMDRAAAIIYLCVAVLSLCLVGGAIWIIIHFASKYW